MDKSCLVLATSDPPERKEEKA